MAGKCKNCKHWVAPKDGFPRHPIGPTIGTPEAACLRLNDVIDIDLIQNGLGGTAIATKFGYSRVGEIYTRANWGCASWEVLE
jgi:hypothetical protein